MIEPGDVVIHEGQRRVVVDVVHAEAAGLEAAFADDRGLVHLAVLRPEGDPMGPLGSAYVQDVTRAGA